jgi:hypothetical protein
VSTATFHCRGQGHQARFSEDFDHVLADVFGSTPDPAAAAEELDDTALLTVLANFAGSGPYEPGQSGPPGRFSFLRVDGADPALRRLHWDWWRSGTPLGRFVFSGRTLTTSQTIVFRARFQPARR